MTPEHYHPLDSTMQSAIDELRGLIERRYPGATFSVSRDPEEAASVHLNATVDVDDTDEVVDLVIDRVLEFQEEQDLPIHVIPLRPAERVVAEIRAQATARPYARRASVLDLPRGGITVR